MYSPEPWKHEPGYPNIDDYSPAPYQHIVDANGDYVFNETYMDGDEAKPIDVKRIVACVNACHGLPDINGTLTLIADMKAAILTGDQELLEIVRKRLVELTDWPPGTGVPEYDKMEPPCISNPEYFQRPFFKSEVKP